MQVQVVVNNVVFMITHTLKMYYTKIWHSYSSLFTIGMPQT